MAKVLLLNPNRWGRGITTIWIASHSARLRASGHEVQLFDCSFYRHWTDNELEFNTSNNQYKPSDYSQRVQWCENDVYLDFRNSVNAFRPDIIFWSAISSHIHGEGEYVSIQYGYELTQNIESAALKICGGLQPTAAPIESFDRFPKLDFLIRGESELVLDEIAANINSPATIRKLKGVSCKNADGTITMNPRQDLIHNLDQIGVYDYSIFDDQVFFRAYNGKVVRAADYELSRGCIYTCTYCVETVIQKYYGFEDKTPRGALTEAKKFLRNKSPERIFEELRWLYEHRGVTLIRCQDTNFLTIDRSTLIGLAALFKATNLPIELYIETRPEGINMQSVQLLAELQVGGVGMGIELATQSFRESDLRRYSEQSKIVAAFKFLREHNIMRTAYNMIGLANQTEESIVETIAFNRVLDPDNITVAFYSPFIGTDHQDSSTKASYFDAYERNIDPQLRTASKHLVMDKSLLDFYKKNFVRFAREGLLSVEAARQEYLNASNV